RVQLLEGALSVDRQSAHQLDEAAIADGWRLACTASITDDCRVRIPRDSLQEEIVAAYADAWGVLEPDTGLQWRDISVPPAGIDDQRSDQQRLRDALAMPDLRLPLSLLVSMPQRLRSDGTHRAVLRGDELVALLPAGHDVLGVACDLGTTTIVVALFDLATGERLGEASCPNPQQDMGADVVSRMGHALSDATLASRLQSMVVDRIQELITELCTTRAVPTSSVGRLVVAGNTAMQHLLLGLDVRGMAMAPFVPATLAGLRLPAADVGFGLACGAELLVMPGIAAYVGGDIVAGLLARRCDESLPGPVLFVDIGTNGELVLMHEGRLTATATAAGPAFEGAGISCGMRARPGAIDRVRFTGDDLRIHSVAEADPVGLCGSGLLEAVAALLDCGLCDETGLLLEDDELEEMPAAVATRVVACESGSAVALDPAARVLLTQKDLRQLQLAKAAIAGGIQVLLQRAGIRPEDLHAVVLAGGFGFHLDLRAAQRVGLLPVGLSQDQVLAVGNTSLAGARLCLLRSDCWQRAAAIAGNCSAIELSGQADFEEAYVDAMEFPEAVDA
ncbi:MAG: ASKHA domain-containing protein, partial [Planctomycetota bacterium]